MNLYQHPKNLVISSFCFRDIVDLKILQYDWLKAFQHISQELNTSQIWNLYRNIVNNINFHYRLNSEKK